MGALPRASSAPGPALRPVPARGRVADASLWTLGTMGVTSVLRLASQMALTYLCLPEHFGIVALMRAFLTFVEMVSDMGIRNAVVAHPRGAERRFLGTAASVQLVRGFGMWAIACALAWPAARFYDAPALLWLLPLAGMESVWNGLFSVRAHVAERDLRVAAPALLELLALGVSIATSVAWALARPGPLALAVGPLAGGCVRALASHVLWRRERVPFGWDRDDARELLAFGRWIAGSTTVSFVAQQFHLLYLAKLLSQAALGVYGVAWSLCAQATKPMTALANRVVVPHLAAAARAAPHALEPALRAATARFLPACLCACAAAGLSAPALFGFFYGASFAAGGAQARLLAVVVWFMVLQHVPRCALLALGHPRAVAAMSAWNAGVTVAGVAGGWALGGLAGAIAGNALGNVAGCAAGWRALRARGLCVGRALVAHSALFLAVLGGGIGLAEALGRSGALTPAAASLATAAAVTAPLALWSLRGVRAREEAPSA